MSDISLSVEPRSDPPGFVIRDPIEGRQVAFRTETVPELAAASVEDFLFPVDRAVSIEIGELRLERNDHLAVWSPDGTESVRILPGDSRSFETTGHQIEISGPVKLYLEVLGPFSVDTGIDHIFFNFEEGTVVNIGARSYHERPAATITIGPTPEDAMAGISAFSSALKSTTPDVSFPTLRGHPPLIEIGDELDVPDGLSTPDSGITIEVPRSRRMIYPTASLAFYLGASVEPGNSPRIRTNDGFEYSLADERLVEDGIARVLRHVLLFDTVVRSEGPHGKHLLERETVEPLLKSDLEVLYDLPMRDRLAEYLAVPFEDVEHLGPRWGMTAYVSPTLSGAEFLPYVADELGIIRNPRGTRIEDREARTSLGVPDERSRIYVTHGDEERYLVRPELFDDSVEHVWFANHIPVGATKGTLPAFENALDRQASTPPIEIALVGSDDFQREDRLPEDAYGLRDEFQFDVHRFADVDANQLRSILTRDFDVLHFVGETRPDGFVTSDGILALSDLHQVEIGVFFLQSDHSFEEALWLAEHGALGGIGTVGSVVEDQSFKFGTILAGLLNMGFPLRGALDIARQEISGGDQFVLVGNGSIDVVQSDSSIPVLVTVEQAGKEFILNWESYPSGAFRVGSRVQPSPANSRPFIAPGDGGQTVRLDANAVRTLFEQSQSPTRVDGQLLWTKTSILNELSLE